MFNSESLSFRGFDSVVRRFLVDITVVILNLFKVNEIDARASFLNLKKLLLIDDKQMNCALTSLKMSYSKGITRDGVSVLD